MAKYAASVADLNNHISNNTAHSDTDITTNVTVNGVPQTSVAGALSAMNTYIGASVPSNATTLAAGLVKLAQDLGGTGLLPQVTGIVGYPINIAGIADQSIIYFDSGQWQTGGLPVSGDLEPFTESGQKRQRVMSISGNIGNSNPVTFSKTLRYNGISNPQIDSADKTGIADTALDTNIYGTNLTHASNTNFSGDIVVAQGGAASGKFGRVTLGRFNNIQLYTLNSGSSKLNLLGGDTAFTASAAASSLSSIGGHVNMIGSSAEPGATNSFGALLYSVSGILKYRNNGASQGRWVGNPENPEIWRDQASNTGWSIYREKFTVAVAANTNTILGTYTASNTAIFSTARPLSLSVKIICQQLRNDGLHANYYEKIYNIKVLSPNTLTIVDSSTAIALGTGTYSPLPAINDIGGGSFTFTSGQHVAAFKTLATIEIRQY